MDGQATLDGPIEEIAWKEAQEADTLLNKLGIAVYSYFIPPLFGGMEKL